VVVLRPKRARAARAVSVARKAEAAGAVSALSGGVPATPVFVAAQNIRPTAAQLNETAGQEAVASAPALSPELLMQKWLHNPAH
jgi:hypothetical protein